MVNRLLNMPEFQYSAPNVNALFAPFNAGLDSYQKQQNERFDQGIRTEQLGLQKRAASRADEQFAMEREKNLIDRLSGLAQVIHDDQNPAQAQANWQKLQSAMPGMSEKLRKYGVDPGDYKTGARYIMAEAGKYKKDDGLVHLKDGEQLYRQVRGADGRITLEPMANNEKTPQGYRSVPGGLEAIPGGPADVKMNEKRQQDFASMQSLNASLDQLSTAANELKRHPGLGGITGLRGSIPNLPGTNAADADAKRMTLLAKTAFTTLQDMRNASKTGGALGAVSDREMGLLQGAIASLEKSQSYDQMVQNLDKIMAHVEAAKARIRETYDDHWNRKGEAARQMQSAPANATNDPLGIR